MIDELPMTPKTLAIALDCSYRTIMRMEKEGMPVIRIGNLHRYLYSDVIRWLRQRDSIPEGAKTL
jgi:phage terminase Nu1 subunit (DNA packaging protein)